MFLAQTVGIMENIGSWKKKKGNKEMWTNAGWMIKENEWMEVNDKINEQINWRKKWRNTKIWWEMNNDGWIEVNEKINDNW